MMSHNSKQFDTSGELLIQRCGNGVILMPPNHMLRGQSMPFNISKMMNLPFNVFFTNREGEIHALNENTSNTCGFVSVKDAIGRTVYSVSKKDTGDIVKANDELVVTSHKFLAASVSYMRKDDIDLEFLSLKYPWYNDKNQCIGIFGFAFQIDTDNNQLSSDVLYLLIQSGLLMPSMSSMMSKCSLDAFSQQIDFTQREKDVLRQLSYGKSNRAIALSLGLSHRTIDEYIARLKNKLGGVSRNALIEKSLAFGNYNA